MPSGAMISGLKKTLVYDDIAGFPPDGCQYELLKGELHVTPAPSPQHQWASKQLQRQLEAYFEGRTLGLVFNAPVDVILTPEDVFEPDIVVITDRALVTTRAIEGVPTLLVEVLSPSSVDYDRAAKSRRYAALGIPHFWIVDCAQTTIEWYRLERGSYKVIARLSGDATAEHPDFPGLGITAAPLWQLV